MRPVQKSTFTSNKTSYNPYGDAKPDLIAALGAFCSYCERISYASALDVEHVKDKSTHPSLKFNWDNFLLACKNCNSIKGTQEVDTDVDLFPHLKNTFHPLNYGESGFISVNSNLPETEKLKAQKLIDLVGLDRIPGHLSYSTKDDRWEYRKETWELAIRYKASFENQKTTVETIIDLARNIGFWSIWITVFEEFPTVKSALLELTHFKGTNTTFFI